MRSASGGIDISTYAQKLDVDNRIPLKIYYRIANNLLKQVNIYREEKNIIDLYVLLLRFSSLVTETIPYHRDYQVLCQSEKSTFKKKLLSALNELEQLKPTAQIQIDDANRRITEVHNQIQGYQNNVNIDSSLAWPPITRQPFVKDMTQQALRHVGQIDKLQRPWNQSDRLSNSSPLEEQIRKLSLTIPRPKQETLSRHSILGPNGLRAPWQPPIVDRGVQYPSNLDLSPIDMPSLHQILPDSFKEQNNIGSSTNDTCNLEAVLSLNEQERSIQVDEPCSVDAYNFDNQVTNLVRQPSPPPILAEVLDLNPTSQAQLDHSVPEPTRALQDELVSIKSPLQIHISTKMMDSFMKLAKSNTQRNLETCGILGGILKDRKFYITALIIPKQESTSDSCQATNEEEIFDVQDKQSLFPLGWIHTHPTQSCFMSSIDVHTHYSYQTMLPEAIAIVMAPRDISRTQGIFRLTTPGGMSVIRNCPLRGFHPHDEPPGGGPIYDHCADVYMNSNLDFSVIDLR